MNEEYCVCCGSPIPEGRMVCLACEHMEVKTGKILQSMNATQTDVTKAYDFLKEERRSIKEANK